MGQRQFRSDDTSSWVDRFGNGGDGALVVSSNISDSARSGYANTTFTGTINASSGTVASNSGFSQNDLVLIHQARNGGSGAGVWELNKISSIAGTTFNLTYPLMNSYGSTAQIYRLPQYSSIEIQSGKTLTVANWDLTKGGIIALICNGTATIAGTVALNGSQGGVTTTTGVATVGGGFQGGVAGVALGAFQGGQGEGSNGASGGNSTANGNGGGGGYAPLGPSNAGGGGGGNNGGTATNGNGVNSGTGGTQGNQAGNAGLTIMVFGGGGGGAGANTGQVSDGASGGGIFILIAKNIVVTGGASLLGADANRQADTQHTGGAGGGGSALFKGQTITLGANLVLASGGTGWLSLGDGGAGRIHADYSNSISGTTTPTIDSRQDASFDEPSGSVY